MEGKKDILWRMYLVYLFISLFGVSIIAKICIIQFSEGEYWKAKAQQLTTSQQTIYAVRGNIFDANGSLLATSLPFYEVAVDINTDYITRELFKNNVDSLSQSLALLFKDKSAREYKEILRRGRESGNRYLLLKRNVSYSELQEVKKFPLFRTGRYKGGLIYVQTNKRENPFKLLAQRTIGYDRKGLKPIGLEGAFDEFLEGDSTTRMMQKIAGGVWMPVNENLESEPKDGCDIISTIDINIQDVAEHALYTQLAKQNAGYGCVVLMEVETGQIKAIANLTRSDSGIYVESYNHAIGSATEPGSTFKLASYAVAMEDGLIDIDDTIDIGDGVAKFYDLVIRDSHTPEKKRISIEQGFESSSNVAVAKTIYKYYSKDPQKFIDGLYKMNLGGKLGLSIPGEGVSKIKTTKDPDWSGTTLPSMSRGYEVLMTPMQILTFYNAFANNGKMVKPTFIQEIKRHGEVIKKFETEVINPAICSQKTIAKARKMMEGVVLNGTAKNLKVTSYPIAGKTGTAQIAQKVGGYGKQNRSITYQASFVGYFPADNPKYSCIVVVNAPSNGVYYGNVVAGPIFREIADKVYSTNLKIHPQINGKEELYASKAPVAKRTSKTDAQKILSELKIANTDNSSGYWVKASLKDSSNILLINDNIEETLQASKMPDLRGMTAEDAIYILENKGIQVKFYGRGSVSEQSIKAGEPIKKGTQVTLKLS